MLKTSFPTILVDDIDKSIAFYTQALGFKAGERHDNFALVHGPDIKIGLHPSRGRKNSGQGNLSIGFEAEDIEAAVEHLAKHGVTCRRFENDDDKFALFSDPDGTGLYLIQPKRQ